MVKKRRLFFLQAAPHARERTMGSDSSSQPTEPSSVAAGA
jgi:hypothetical protein